VDDPTDEVAPIGEPGPGAFVEDFDTSAEFFTLMAGPADAGSVHGLMQIWYSENLRPLVTSGEGFVAPEGSVAIKRQGADMDLYNIMIKPPAGDAPEAGDWWFEQRDASFAVTRSGSVDFCVDCHAGYPERDLLAGVDER
jgi:hypothetical protein